MQWILCGVCESHRCSERASFVCVRSSFFFVFHLSVFRFRFIRRLIRTNHAVIFAIVWTAIAECVYPMNLDRCSLHKTSRFQLFLFIMIWLLGFFSVLASLFSLYPPYSLLPLSFSVALYSLWACLARISISVAFGRLVFFSRRGPCLTSHR